MVFKSVAPQTPWLQSRKTTNKDAVREHRRSEIDTENVTYYSALESRCCSLCVFIVHIFSLYSICSLWVSDRLLIKIMKSWLLFFFQWISTDAELFERSRGRKPRRKAEVKVCTCRAPVLPGRRGRAPAVTGGLEQSCSPPENKMWPPQEKTRRCRGDSKQQLESALPGGQDECSGQQ